MIARVGFSAVFLLVFGAVSLGQYGKYLHGRGFISHFLPNNLPNSLLVLLFVVVPFLAAILFAWLAARELEKQGDEQYDASSTKGPHQP